jgi:plastocyanin
MRPAVRSGRAIAFGVAVAAAAMSPAALADERITATPPDRYNDTSPSMDQGERLTFLNLDVRDHNVVAKLLGPDRRPIFASPTIGPNQEAFVEGSQYLVTGRYDFFCTIHSYMVGTLTVTSAGTPAPRPGGGGDKAPALGLEVATGRLRTVERSGRLPVDVSADESVRVDLSATARRSGRTVTIARGSSELAAPGERRVKLRLTRAGRSAVAASDRLRVTVRASARDSAGNETPARATRTLR